jgi:hypothetical protein
MNEMVHPANHTLPDEFPAYWDTRYFQFKMATSYLRIQPSYLIVGAQKGGTTSLYRYLASHPQVIESYLKEVHFFDLNFRRKERWYRAHFALHFPHNIVGRLRKKKIITGDCTPYYLFHPHAPSRVASLYPDMKIIAVLRNPVDRAYSHYMHNKRKGRETRSFDAAIAEEQTVMPAEIERMALDADYYSHYHRHFSYLYRGIYVDQLARWARHIPQKQTLILHSEEIFLSPQKVFAKILRFLDLRDHHLDDYRAFNKQSYSSHMQRKTREELNDFFQPHNKRLYEYLGVDYSWK